MGSQKKLGLFRCELPKIEGHLVLILLNLSEICPFQMEIVKIFEMKRKKFEILKKKG